MAKSLSSILSQIERLQREAASIQSEVIHRIKKDIAKYGLTAEQLFGQAGTRQARTSKPAKKATPARAAKYADGAGNTWGGMGKRPDWLRQALEAGQSLEDFLVARDKPKVASTLSGAKVARHSKHGAAGSARAASKKRVPAKDATRKPRASAAASPSE